jgi:hypothetical protein
MMSWGAVIQQMNKEQGMIKLIGRPLYLLINRKTRPMEIGNSLFLVHLLNGFARPCV